MMMCFGWYIVQKKQPATIARFNQSTRTKKYVLKYKKKYKDKDKAVVQAN